MPAFVVCPDHAIAFGDEAMAERSCTLLNHVRSCGGIEHMVVVADTAPAARDAYMAAMRPAPPARKDLD